MDRLSAPWLRRLAKGTVVPLAIGGTTLACAMGGANEITASLLLLMAVLGLATWGGWAVGAAASLMATLCLSLFFLPSTGTLTIEEACFLAAATLVSHLVTRAREKAAEALDRRGELEVLYDLSSGLFTATPAEAAARTLRALGADAGGALVLSGSEPVFVGHPMEIDATLLDAARRDSTILEDGGTSYIPLQIAGHLAGVLVASEPTAPPAVRDPAVRLLALAVERERLLQERAHLEAVRESDSLKTALLRAISHDLRTPLTSIRLEIESLERRFASQSEERASLRGLSVQQERLTRRIDNLLSLARLEAGVARPQPEPTPAGSLFRAAREQLALVLAGRPLEVNVQPGCPDLWTDPSMSLEMLVNLLENAARSAPADQPIELAATSVDGHVRLEVKDRGPGLPANRVEGLGLRIVRSLAAADGGSIELLDRPGGGTIARLDLPRAPEPEEIPAG